MQHDCTGLTRCAQRPLAPFAHRRQEPNEHDRARVRDVGSEVAARDSISHACHPVPGLDGPRAGLAPVGSSPRAPSLLKSGYIVRSCSLRALHPGRFAPSAPLARRRADHTRSRAGLFHGVPVLARSARASLAGPGPRCLFDSSTTNVRNHAHTTETMGIRSSLHRTPVARPALHALFAPGNEDSSPVDVPDRLAVIRHSRQGSS